MQNLKLFRIPVLSLFIIGFSGLYYSYAQSAMNNGCKYKIAGNVMPKYQTRGITERSNLPVFYTQLAERLTYPLSWTSGNYNDFSEWKKEAREKVMECLLYSPPPVPFDPIEIGEEDRGSYTAKKIVFNISADSRVLSYMLVPKGEGPFPAVLLLHDHGTTYNIGKEKMVRPFDIDKERMESSQEWINKKYGGRYIGDELAQRGYICFSFDALYWSDRGGGQYEGQQALSSNLLNLGSSLAGTIAYDDLRAAEFFANYPGVDSSRIAAMGLSMGAQRTWQIAALSDHIKAGVAICWMATNKGIMVPGNNITSGQSAYTMTHPGLFNYLDYPDVASIACPKPMLFFNGLKDRLFPVPSVEDAYRKMHQVWKSQNAGSKLYTRLWDDIHNFSLEMQEDAFNWLDKYLK